VLSPAPNTRTILVIPVPAFDPRRPDTLPAHLHHTQAEREVLLQRAIRLRAGSLDRPWYRRQDERAGIRFWLGLVASNMRGWQQSSSSTSSIGPSACMRARAGELAEAMIARAARR